MNPDRLIQELAVITEEVIQPMYNESGLQEPITRDQWLALRERFDRLCVKNTPRLEVVNG